MNAEILNQNWRRPWRALLRAVPCMLNGLVLLSLVMFFFSSLPVRADEGDLNPRFSVFPEQDAVEGWDWPLDAAIHLAIDDPETEVSPDFEQDGVMILAPWGSGQHWVWFDFANAYDLTPGDTVTLSDGTTPRTHTVQNLTITALDAEADTVAGTATPDSEVYVWPYATGEQVMDKADSAGNWKADLTGTYDLVPGDCVRAEIRDEQGNSTAVDWCVPQTDVHYFRDGLPNPWYWVNEVPDAWFVDEENGLLVIQAAKGATGSENLLLRPVGEGDFMIKTHVFFEPQENFQFAGLVIYQDGENYFQLGRAYCDLEEVCAGNAIYFDYSQNPWWAGLNFATTQPVFDEAYLRLERRGNRITGFFSQEGITWTVIGTHDLPEGFQINAVGLTTAQDYSEGSSRVLAAFEFFELGEDRGFLPEGFHDYDSGDVPSWACNVGGWAADPDDRKVDLAIEVVVDGVPLPEWLYAGEYRQDLADAGVCEDGYCSFQAELWDLISHYEEHSIVAYAQDVPSGEWVQLSNSPKTLTCRTYDIYTYNPETGETVQLSDLRWADEYSPAWSGNARKLVYDVWDGTNHDLWITDLKTGTSTPLSGGEGGADAAWSPEGKWIVFDRAWMGDNNLYRVSEDGGKPALVKEDAIQAAWSPDSKRLVFHRPSDGSLMTSGARGDETLFLAASGAHPAWSEDGKYIAYEDGGAIFRIRVDPKGAPLGEPVQVTFLPGWAGMPAWSPDSQTILFHYGLDRDFDIWSVPTAGGTPSWLAGAFGFGDYDPVMAKAAPYLAYASFSPEGQASRRWVAALTYDLPAGYWSEGGHSYQWQTGDPDQNVEIGFTVSGDALIYDNYVMLRHNSVVADGGEGCGDIDVIHPSQKTRFVIGWAVDGTYPEALAYFDGLGLKVSWDDNAALDLNRHEIRPFDSLDWWSYVCTYTQPPNRSISTGNFDVEWNPFNVEEISSLRWKGSENLVNSWEHWLYPGNLEYFGNSWVSENEGEEPFYFRSLVGWGTAGTWAQNGTQVKIRSMSTFTGEPLIPVQTGYRFFDDEKRADLIAVERIFEFGEEGYPHDIRPYIPRLFPRDEFTQVLHPNARGKAVMTVLAEECEYGCEITNWNGAWFAIHNPTSGQGLLVLHEPSSYDVSLWVDVDSGSWTNASSVLLKQPDGGFTGTVTETEYLCFYDSSLWVPSNRVPPGCLLGLESSQFNLAGEPAFNVFLPTMNR
jgi:Tol biopolymer transport system component/regulation of enolase protein 1 (concanavalin A-like superfamily)